MARNADIQLQVNGRNLQDATGKNVLLHGYMQPAASYFNGGTGVNFTDPTGFYASDVAGELNYFKNVAELMTHTNALFGKSHGWYCSYVRYLDGNCRMGEQRGADRRRHVQPVDYQHVRALRPVLPVRGTLCGYLRPTKPGPIPMVLQDNMTAQYKANLIAWWTAVAGTSGIKSADNVMFEICNEPVGDRKLIGKWRLGLGSSSYNAAFQTYMKTL